MYEFFVSHAAAGRKLSSILFTTHGMSRRFIRRVIAEDGIRRNGEPVLLSAIVSEGDKITIALPQETSHVSPEPMNLTICYEDDNILVVNKPAGVLTHPSARERTGSLLAGIAAYLQPQGLVPHSVHRLDKYTSGTILFAKHAHAHHLLDVALRNHLVHRNYIALAFSASPLDLHVWQTFTDEIAQDPNKPSRRIIGEAGTGQTAITHLLPIAHIGPLYLCAFRLETGRTHQIRLQMASRGMPLVGDRDYTYAYSGLPVTDLARYYERVLPHQALHAYQLSWTTQTDTGVYTAYARPSDEIEELWNLMGGIPSIHEIIQNTLGT